MRPLNWYHQRFGTLPQQRLHWLGSIVNTSFIAGEAEDGLRIGEYYWYGTRLQYDGIYLLNPIGIAA